MASSNDSASEGLKKILGQIGQLMALPDADPQALTMLMQIITKILQKGAAGAPGGPPPPGAGGGPPPGMGAGPPPGLGGPPGAMGLSLTGPNAGPEGAPNADELRRLLSAGGATQ